MPVAAPFEAFKTALTSSQRAKLGEGIDRLLAECLAKAREKWPKLKVDDAAFLLHLAARLDGAADVPEALVRLKVADLYVAFACAQRDAAAMEALEARVKPELYKALAPYQLDAAARDEVLQRLRERVFIAKGKAAPRIATYAGVGPLAAWLCAAVVRLAIDTTRGAGAKPTEDEALADQVQDPSDLELSVIKRRYQKEFRRAFQLAFKALTAEERNLVRFNFIDGLNIEQIGTMQGVHRSTVARRIARIREELLEGTRAMLRERFKLTASEVNSLLRVVKSDFGVSLNEALSDPSAKR